jgi:hypothetical protein
MENKLNPKQVYAYTQHAVTIKALEKLCNVNIKLLTQDRSRDPIDDILSQIPVHNAVLYAVLPIDKAIEFRKRAPGIRLVLMQLDAKIVERLSGQPYNPKMEYPLEIIMQALKTFEVKDGNIKTMNFDELRNMLHKKTVAVFNDTMRQALAMLMPNTTFVKTCDNADCIEINPLGNKSGLRISFPGSVGQLNAQQMAELISSGKARIYYAEVEVIEVHPCLN